MRVARIAVLGVAISAGGAAALMVGGGQPGPAPAPAAVAPAPVATVDVLVAAQDLAVGRTLTAADLRWQAWPAAAATAGFIKRKDAPNALEEAAGALVRSAHLAGEPIRGEKLIKGDGGFMSAILPSGMRAVAIAIDNRGSTSAGGFILPNDRVDVIHTHSDGSGGNGAVSEIVLSNIRVLAIGQTVQEKNGDKVVTGETATLELTPAQAESIVLAQRLGQLSLALRSLADAKDSNGPDHTGRAGGLTIIRYGVSQQAPRL
jgi:pilus assembly protein CpaB